MKPYDVPRLKPGQTHFTGKREWGVLSHLGSFHIRKASSKHDPQFKLHIIDGHELDPGHVFHGIFRIPIEGVYEYLALWISALGLTIIAGEKLLHLVKWLFN